MHRGRRLALPCCQSWLTRRRRPRVQMPGASKLWSRPCSSLEQVMPLWHSLEGPRKLDLTEAMRVSLYHHCAINESKQCSTWSASKEHVFNGGDISRATPLLVVQLCVR